MRKLQRRADFKHTVKSLCLSSIPINADRWSGYRPPSHGQWVRSCISAASGRISVQHVSLALSAGGETSIRVPGESFAVKNLIGVSPVVCPWGSQDSSGYLQADAVSPKPLLM